MSNENRIGGDGEREHPERLKHERREGGVLEHPGTGKVPVVEGVAAGEVASSLPEHVEVVSDALVEALLDRERQGHGNDADGQDEV